MAIEVGSFVDDLVQTNPPSSDPVGQGDDHLRLIKAVLLATLPNMGSIMGQVRRQDTAATAQRVWNTNQLVVSNSATATVVLTLPAAASITTGWSLGILTLAGASVSVLPGAGGSISSAASFSIPEQSIARVFYEGTGQWRAVASPAGGPRTALSGDLYVPGNTTLSGSVQLNTTLSVNGRSSFSGSVDMASTLRVTGAANLLSTLSVSGAATINGALAGTSAAFNGVVSISGATTLNTTLNVQGATTLSGSVQCATTLAVNGRSSFSGSVDMATTLRVSGAVVMLGAVSISGATNFATTVTISGAATLKSTVSIGGAVNLGSSITISGLVTLTAGQIAFPASQNASANANILDDYEEGTWTPSISFPTLGDTAVVYSLRSGTYTKIGDVCHVECNIVTSAFTHTTASGNLLVSGFPFSAATSSAGDVYPFAVGYMTGITTTGTQTGIMLPTTDSNAIFVSTNYSTGSGSVLQHTDAASGVNKTIVFGGTYKTA